VIHGYPRWPSVASGERLVLHVATDAPRFRVALLRWHDGFAPMYLSAWLPGRAAPFGDAAHDWQRPDYALDIPRGWPSGAYVAHLQTQEGDRPGIGQIDGAALFTVRGSGAHSILYKLPLATYHAYNWMGGGCFYDRPLRNADPPGSRVTFLRPGGGIGGVTHGAIDAYDPSSARQTFAHWDARFIAWLARQGCGADFCTDLDLHRDPALLARYRLVVSVGHDEYWSERLRDAMEDYVRAGGNAAFFGANLCWWRVHVVDGDSAMVCHQGGPAGALDHWWPPSGANRPEDALTGVSYRHGGGWWDGPRETAGYVACQPRHWVLAGTGLEAGSRLGRETTPPLVGYECDGVPLAHFDADDGMACLEADAHDTGTPPELDVLAVAPLDARWNELPLRRGHAAGEGIHAATMCVHRRGGTVFTAGTTDWAQVLEQDPRVARITRNVIERLGASRT
jgi:hypothetical protein